MKNAILLVVLSIFLTSSIRAQNLKLANHLFKNKSYIKALNLFEAEENKTQDVYEKLGDCYYFNNQMENAVKWYKELMVFHEASTDQTYYFKYAQALKGIEEYDAAKLWLKKYKKKIKSDENDDASQLDKLLIDKSSSIYKISSVEGNTEATDFGGTFYQGKLVFSSSRAGGKSYHWNKKPYLDLYQADIDSIGNLNNIKPFSEKINTKLHESNAVFTKDSTTMYFTRNNWLKGRKIKDENKVTHLKIYSAEFVEGHWDNIKELPFSSDNYSIVHPALSDDGKQLYFSSDMPGTIGSFDLFVVSIDNENNFGEPVNLGPTVNTAEREQFPFFSKDTLYYSSNGLLGFGGLDIFNTYKKNDKYTTPKNLKIGINSSLDDFGYVLNEKKSKGYFSSNRGGGEDNIYRFNKTKNALIFNGILKERLSLNAVDGAKVTLFDEKGNLISTIISKDGGKFAIKIQPDKSYTIKVNDKLHTPKSLKFKTKDFFSKEPRIILLDLYQTVEASIVVKNHKTQIDHEPIYFDLNSSYLKPEAKLILDHVVEIMKKHQAIKIHCGAHTDSWAGNKYNKWLSLRRSKRTADYVVAKGIDPNRITNDGYGETQLVNRCSNGVKCSKAEHQLNRRTEFVLE